MFSRIKEQCFALLILMAFNLVAYQKPNFVLILADDLGYGDLGFTGSTQISTPHIDALAKDGVIFTQGYVSSAVCGPSRAGLMTGKNQVRFGFDNNLTNYLPQFKDEFHGLPVSEKTLATRLAEQGYTNGLIGKWHLGDKEQYHPLRRGFHEFWGYLGGGRGLEKKIPKNYKAYWDLDQLYDLSKDRKEQINLVKKTEYAQKLKSMQKLLSDHIKDQPGTFGEF